MAKGKFSNPRPYRDEEREIEQAFRQVTEGTNEKKTTRTTYTPTPAEETLRMPALEVEKNPLTDEVLLEEFGEILPDFSEGPLREEPHEEEELREDAGETEPDFWDKLVQFVEANKKMVLVGTCALALALVLIWIVIFCFSAAADPYNGKILNNVIVAGVNVGGLNKSDAIQAVEQATEGVYTQKDMIVRLGGTTLTLSPGDTGAKLDVKAAVNAAYDYGRTGTKEEKQAAYTASFTGNHTIGLLPYLNLNEDYILGMLNDYSQSVGSILQETTYTLEGTVPDLAADVFDPETAQPLTLTITMGTPGVNFQVDELFDRILDAYSLCQFQVIWENTDPEAEPAELDWDQVVADICLDPVDATMDLQTYKVIPGSYGYTFDVEVARQLVAKAQYGQLVRVEMEYVAPEILGEDAMYQDVLATCKTPYSNNANRINNLQLACAALDGLVLNPGQTFSYNETLGERTTAKGYKSAPAYSGLNLVNAVGGGICQVSSTLYCATLMADLETVERSDHGFTVSYIDYGMDAAVNWGGPDLKFKNNTNYPIKLKAEAANGYVTIQILGTDEKDYYIEMSYSITNVYEPETEYKEYKEDNAEGYKDGDVLQKGVTGYFVRTYKNKYDKVTGQLISKDYVTSSRYLTVNKIVVKIIPAETTEPTQEPTEPSTEPSTEPDTEPTVPETQPSTQPSTEPTTPPSTEPTDSPSGEPSTEPSSEPTAPPATDSKPEQTPVSTEPGQEAPEGEE